MPKKHLCFWPNLRHQPKTAFSRLPPLHRANLEGRLRVDFAHSPSRQGRPAFCAQGTAGVDVKRTLRIAAVGVAVGRKAGPTGSPREEPESGP